MSVTVGTSKSRTRFHLRDRDPSDFVFSSPELERTLEARMRIVAAETKLGQDWTTLAVTAATDTYSMPGTQQYAQVLRVRRQSDGFSLDGPLSREEFERWREGQTSTVVAKARPERFTLYETEAQALKIQLHPWPNGAETLDILRSLLPEAFTNDATAIPFDELAGEALAYGAAAELVAMATDEALSKRGLNRSVAALYEREAARLMSASRVRRDRQRAASRVVRVRR